MIKVEDLDYLWEGKTTEKFTEKDYYVEKEWHSLYEIPSVNKIEAFKGAFAKKKKFDLYSMRA